VTTGQERTVPEPAGRTMNDDQSPLITLMSCMVCAKTMKFETIAPDGEGDDLLNRPIAADGFCRE
jgi:hypothetical protein